MKITKQIGECSCKFEHNEDTGETSIEIFWHNPIMKLVAFGETTFIPRFTVYKFVGELTLKKHRYADIAVEFGLFVLGKIEGGKKVYNGQNS